MDAEISKKIGSIGDIPPMPKVANTVMKLVSDPNSSAQELQKVISVDEGLSSKVLKMANSAFFGCMSTITSVRQALVIIGFNTVKSLVIASSTSSLFKKAGADEATQQQLWQHSVGCSFVARMVAQKKGLPDVDEIFTGALLHDLGRLIIFSKLPEEFKQIIEKKNTESKSFYEVEKEILGFDHAEVGLFIAEKWKLPDLLKDIMAYHHVPSKSSGHIKSVAAVMLADAICIKAGIGAQVNEDLNLEEVEGAKILELKNSVLDPMVAEAKEKVESDEMAL